MGPLSTGPKARFPVALGHRRKDHPYRQLHLLRSFLPSASPFALTRVAPGLVAVTLLVVLPLSRPNRPNLGASTRLSPCGPNSNPLPKDRIRDLRDRVDPWSRVKPPQNNELNWISFVGSPQPSSGLDRTTSRWQLLLP
jgi:hypothetical protein